MRSQIIHGAIKDSASATHPDHENRRFIKKLRSKTVLGRRFCLV